MTETGINWEKYHRPEEEVCQNASREMKDVSMRQAYPKHIKTYHPSQTLR